MTLIPDFKATFTKLWSVRFMALAICFEALEIALPMLYGGAAVPPGVSLALTVLALVSRGVAQPSLYDPQP